MTQKLTELKRLGDLADLILDRDLAQLAQVTSERELVRAQLIDLEKDLGHLIARSGEKVMPAANFTNTADAKWQAWRRVTKINLNTDLAKIESERQVNLVKARFAFGRSQVVQGLLLQRKP